MSVRTKGLIMSSWIRKITHKETGEEHEIFAIDGYFGAHKYGYKLPNGIVLTSEQFTKEYNIGD